MLPLKMAAMEVLEEKEGRKQGHWRGQAVGQGKQTRKFIKSPKKVCWFGKVWILQFG